MMVLQPFIGQKGGDVSEQAVFGAGQTVFEQGSGLEAGRGQDGAVAHIPL